MKISPKFGYDTIKFLLYLGVVVQISRVGLSFMYINDYGHFSTLVIPIFIRVVLLYYFIKRINIVSSLLWINILMLIVYPILILFNGYNIFDIPIYFQLFISLLIIVLLSINKLESELIINDSNLVKKTNKTIYWIYLISIVLSNSLNKSFDKSQLNSQTQNLNEENFEILDTLENSIIERTKDLPQMVDNVTSFDSIKFYRGDSTISYYYSLTNMTISELDMNKFNKILKNNIVKEIKNDSNMMSLINNFHINYEFVYYDKERSLLTRIESKNLILK
jgi:hypothetical protein